MRVALFLEHEPNTGGGFQQALSTIESLVKRNATRHEFVVFTPFERTRRKLLNEGIEATLYKRGIIRLLDRWSATTVGNAILHQLRRLGLPRIGHHLDS